MRDLDALAGSREQHRVIADDVAAAHGREADRLRIAFAGGALASVDRDAPKVAPERLRNHLAHLQRGTGRRVDLVPMVRLDDLDVVFVSEYAGCHLEQAQRDVHADAHVRREHDRNRLGRARDRRASGIVEPGRSDHHPDAAFDARAQVRQRARRPGEVDQEVGLRDGLIDAGADRHPGFATEEGACVLAERSAAGDVERACELRVGRLEHGFHERAAHAAGCAGDRDSHRHGCPPSAVGDGR